MSSASPSPCTQWLKKHAVCWHVGAVAQEASQTHRRNMRRGAKCSNWTDVCLVDTKCASRDRKSDNDAGAYWFFFIRPLNSSMILLHDVDDARYIVERTVRMHPQTCCQAVRRPRRAGTRAGELGARTPHSTAAASPAAPENEKKRECHHDFGGLAELNFNNDKTRNASPLSHHKAHMPGLCGWRG